MPLASRRRPSEAHVPFRWRLGLFVAALVAAVSSFIQLGLLRDPSFDPIASIRSSAFLRDFVPRFVEIFFAFVLAMTFQRWRERRRRRSAEGQDSVS